MHHFLGDVAAGVGLDGGADLGELFVARLGSDDDPVAARLGHRFEDELVEPIEDVAALVGFPREVGLDIGDDGSFPGVVLDELGDEGIHTLVVRRSVAEGVGHRHVAGVGGRHQAGNAEQGIRPKHDRVEKLVTDAPIDHVHPLQPSGGAHVDHVVVDDEVPALHQFDAHLAGEEGMLEVGRVGDPRGEHHDGRVSGARRGNRPQGAQQHRAVVIDRTHQVLRERHRQHPRHRHPILEDVGDSRRHPEVVFQDSVGALSVSDDVDAGDDASS